MSWRWHGQAICFREADCRNDFFNIRQKWKRQKEGGEEMIFCVEDDNNIRDLLVYTLETTGFHARGLIDSQEL